jgi:hypothetical protein
LATVEVSQDQFQLVVPFAVCHAPSSTEVCTELKLVPLLEDAEPDTDTVPTTVAPGAGVEMLTAGGGVALLTETNSLMTDETLPAVSVVCADSSCDPFAAPLVFQDQLQLVVPLAVCQAPPSTEVCTEATASLPAVAEPETETVPEFVDPEPGEEILTVGGVGGGVELELLTETDLLATAETLPAVSVARALRVCVPLATLVVSHDQLQAVVPLAVCQEPPSTEIRTLATA